MSLRNWRIVYFCFCLILILTACAPAIRSFMKINEERFLVLAVLGEEGKAENYYPGQSIEIGDAVRWTLYLNNKMDEVKYVSIRVKLINSTIKAPDITSCRPSPSSVLYEIRRVLLDNETLLCPFYWTIETAVVNEDFSEIRQISINSRSVKTSIVAKDGNNFRFIFELWVYNETLNDFQFGWKYGDRFQCAWNQIWFNSTSVS